MPMTHLAVGLYLGIILAGCAVVGIADSFSPKEVASRLRIAGCKLLFTQDVVFRGSKKLPLYERVTKETDIPVVVLTARQELQATPLPFETPFSQLNTFKPQNAAPSSAQPALSLVY